MDQPEAVERSCPKLCSAVLQWTKCQVRKIVSYEVAACFSSTNKAQCDILYKLHFKNKEMVSFISNQVLELICSFLLAAIYLSSNGICFIRATMWKTQAQRSVCFLQEQCEQSINVILMPDKVLCYSREHNNEETYREPGLLVFGFLPWYSSKVGSAISNS